MKKINLKLKKVIVLLVIISILSLTITKIQMIVIAADTSDIVYNVNLKVTYQQTEARKMLDMINEFRTSNEAWYWESDNTTKKMQNNLKNYVYDYELEQIAMKRAAEIAIYFSHTRPNGESCFSLCPSSGSSYGENICAGYSTASSAFDGWKETDEDYSGQGHRRSMLSSNFTHIGIGHVYYNGYHYWVQEFNNAPGNVTELVANDSTTDVDIDIISENITNVRNDVTSLKCEVDYNNKINVPTVKTYIKIKDSFPANREYLVYPKYTWNIENEAIAKIVDNQILGVKVGSTNLNTTIFGETITIPVTINKISLNSATVVLNQDKFIYDKTAKTPEVTVLLNGKTLESSDYDVNYKNNINVGIANVIITGKGNYTGSITKNFNIDCEHKYRDEEIPVDCIKDGKIIHTCEICGNINEEKTETAKGHEYLEKVTKATTSKNGNVIKTCTKCGDEKTEVIYYPKTVTLSSTAYTYNGGLKKPGVTVKDSKGIKINSSNYTLSYTNNKNVGIGKVKITFKGKYSGSITKIFKINPKSTSISSLKAKSKGFTVKIKKQTTQTTGYQIQYSTSNKFKSAKTVTITKNKTVSKTISKLKRKKRYYVRVRTYKVVNGTKYYSSWSSAKYITTKK